MVRLTPLEHARRHYVEELLVSVCQRHGIVIDVLLAGVRSKKVVVARRECAQRLREKGLRWRQVGKVLNVHYITAFRSAGQHVEA